MMMMMKCSPPCPRSSMPMRVAVACCDLNVPADGTHTFGDSGDAGAGTVVYDVLLSGGCSQS